MILWLVAIAVIAPSVILSVLVRFAPARVMRLAFVPVRQAVTLALPTRVADVVAPPQADTGTYRESPIRDVALVALPGAARVARDGHVIRFLTDRRCILAHPRSSPGRLLRVDVAGDAGGWVLRARRLPSDELAGGAMALGLVGCWLAGLHWPAWILVGMVVAQSYAVLDGWRTARASFDAVIAEMNARTALANGETPLSSELPPLTGASRFTGPDEWTCACGKVNARKREMCGRCWSQRPAG